MPSKNPPTFVLILGSWHTAAHGEPLVQALERRGYASKIHQLAQVGLKESRPTYADDVKVVLIGVMQELDAGCEVVLVLHSYAGLPDGEALSLLIQQGRLNPQDGKGSFIKVIFLALLSLPPGVVFDASAFAREGNGMLSMLNPRDTFFNDIADDTTAQRWVDALEPAYYLGRDPVLSSEDWRKAPILAVLLKQDHALPPHIQEAAWQDMETVVGYRLLAVRGASGDGR